MIHHRRVSSQGGYVSLAASILHLAGYAPVLRVDGESAVAGGKTPPARQPEWRRPHGPASTQVGRATSIGTGLDRLRAMRRRTRHAGMDRMARQRPRAAFVDVQRVWLRLRDDGPLRH